jgi:metallo-beta-lactamase class B
MRLLLGLALCLTASAAETDLGGRVWVSQVAAHTWQVRSVSAIEGYGDVESNALVVVGTRESILVDTPVSPEQTERVLAWADGRLHRPVQNAILTHAHDDRMGGIDALHARHIETYAFGKTIAIARERKLPLPRHELAARSTFRRPGIAIDIFYPGPGHTVDNLVVWIPGDRVLHGGCFVKAAGAKDLGNVREADVSAWGPGIAALRRTYAAKAKLVVPGHGALGGPELLSHTADLIAAAGR